jgi:Cu/Ag efflux protein CusF
VQLVPGHSRKRERDVDEYRKNHLGWDGRCRPRGIRALAQQTLTGSVTRVDEANGKITIQQAQSGTVGATTGSVAEDFRVQDGLLFNASQPGDKVAFTATENNGVKTITEIRKQ